MKIPPYSSNWIKEIGITEMKFNDKIVPIENLKLDLKWLYQETFGPYLQDQGARKTQADIERLTLP
jgi:hypothetical protein